MKQGYVILDAARVDSEMQKAKLLCADNVSLYKGEVALKLDTVAPFLFHFGGQNGKFKNWFAHNGWGNSWGVFIESGYPIEEVQGHLRRFLMVRMEDTGKQVYFRYYDPRVLRVFLPTCDTSQIREFFGYTIKTFICESEQPEHALVYSIKNDELHCSEIPASHILPELNHEPIEIEALAPKNIPLTPEQQREVEEIRQAAGYEEIQESTSEEQGELVTEEPSEATHQETKTPPKKPGGRRFKFID